MVLGPAGSRPALYASLCLRFWWNSDEPRPLNGTQVTTNWAGERPARHHIPLPSGDMHSRFLPFLSSAVELPASCAGAVLCGRLPHTAPLVLPARPRADKTTLLLSRHPHTLCLVGGVHPATRTNRGLCFGKTVVCIFFWVSFVFSPDLVQVVFSFSIWSPIYFLWFEQGLFVFFW